MRRPQLVSRGTIHRMRLEAEQAWNQRKLDDCINILERISRLDPADPGILLQLGRVYGICYDYCTAERCFEKAVRVTPGHRKAEILAAVGLQAKDFYNTKIAENYFQRAIQEKDLAPEMLIRAAEFSERLRRPDEASALVDRAFQFDSSNPQVLFARAHLYHSGGRLEDAEQLLRRLLKAGNPEVRAKAGYELGTVLDRQGRYDEAMSIFLEVKERLVNEGKPHLAQLKSVRARLEQVKSDLSSENFRSWRENRHELSPHFRVCTLAGHPRSGTTLLEQVLDSHPDVVSAEETTNFNDYAYLPLERRFPLNTPILKILNSVSNSQLLTSRSDYINASNLCLGNQLQGKVLIDKNPSLTFLIPAISRIFPESKYLVAIRDPRDVVLSCFMQPFLPVQQVSSAYLTLENTVEEYTALMSMWQTVKSSIQNPFLEIRYEDMVEDLETVARKSLDFLEVSWDPRVLGFHNHAGQKVVRSPTYSDVTQKVFKRARGRWLNYEKFIEPYLAKLSPFLKAFGYE